MADSDLGPAEQQASGSADPYERTVEYLERHNILQVFQIFSISKSLLVATLWFSVTVSTSGSHLRLKYEITESLVYDRPDDPLRFMLEQLQKMIQARDEMNKAVKDE